MRKIQRAERGEKCEPHIDIPRRNSLACCVTRDCCSGFVFCRAAKVIYRVAREFEGFPASTRNAPRYYSPRFSAANGARTRFGPWKLRVIKMHANRVTESERERERGARVEKDSCIARQKARESGRMPRNEKMRHEAFPLSDAQPNFLVWGWFTGTEYLIVLSSSLQDASGNDAEQGWMATRRIKRKVVDRVASHEFRETRVNRLNNRRERIVVVNVNRSAGKREKKRRRKRKRKRKRYLVYRGVGVPLLRRKEKILEIRTNQQGSPL